MSDKHLEILKREKLAADEDVVCWISATRETDVFAGVAFVTHRRVGYFRKKMTGEIFEAIPIDKLGAVDVKSSWKGRDIDFAASGSSIKLTPLVSKEEMNRFLAAVEECRHPSEVAAPSMPTPSSDPLTQLERLGQLHKAGIITATEFEEKKGELLSRI